MTVKEVEGTYHSWKNSLLAKKIVNQNRIYILDKVWDKASKFYPRATWKGWVDHSATHVLSVLRNLDRLIPPYVHAVILEKEAFVLIAATLLHDIGMTPEENVSTTLDLQYFANLRLEHGSRGAKIIKREFYDSLKPIGEILDPICEIVKNHHGNFNPMQRADLPYDLRTDALWVRLADELDFGPDRAPAWLIEYIKPDENELRHWRNHNEVQEPAIDLELFRIQIMGNVEDESLVQKLRAEFESPQRQDLQKIFLTRGLAEQRHNRTFLIWDLTEIKRTPAEDSKEVDTRPAIFSNEQFLLGARYLYNLGRYEVALKCFEEGVARLSGRWSDMPAILYFYHYLKTLHGLGKHKEALEVTEQYRDRDADFPPEIRAVMATSDGLGYWKLGDFDAAKNSLRMATEIYNVLAQRDIKHKVNEADTWVLYSIVYLEKGRTPDCLHDKSLIRKLEYGIRKANSLFLEYENARPKIPEVHYRGRYWGLRAFFSLLQLDHQIKKDAKVWTKALKFSTDAHGGAESAHRNPFGAMCGRYSLAAVNYHKYINCESQVDKHEALIKSARSIGEVRQTYDELFGPTKKIFRLWPKIHHLFVLVRDELPDESRSILLNFYGSDEPTEEVEIYTPLH